VQLDTQAKEFDTQQLKKMFHESLGHPYEKSAALEADEESSNDISRPRALQLGKFEIDPDFTDFIGECFAYIHIMALFACEDYSTVSRKNTRCNVITRAALIESNLESASEQCVISLGVANIIWGTYTENNG
jgi:hypothetical protein